MKKSLDDKRFIQIAMSDGPGGGWSLVALAKDGTVWHKNNIHEPWERVNGSKKDAH